MEKSRKHRWLKLIVIAVISLSTGCSLINPHISWDEPPSLIGPQKGGPSAGNTNTSANLEKYSLEWSIEYAENAKKAYKKALGNQSDLSSWLGIGLIPLASATLGLGILDKSHTQATWMGLGAASGYAVGSWLYSKPKQKAYVAGYNATCCAIEAILPLHYVINKEEKFNEKLEGLYSEIEVVKSAIGNVKSLCDQISKDSQEVQLLIKQADDVVKTAEALVTSANDITAKAKSLDFQVKSSGMSLKEAVDRINSQVSGILVETGADIQSLSSVIGGLAGAYGEFVKIPQELKTEEVAGAEAQAKVDGAKAPVEKEKPDVLVDNLRSGIEDLNKEVSKLSEATHKMSDLLNTVAASKPTETLKSCGVSAESIAVPISVDPAGPINFKEKTASSMGCVIKGGVAPYMVSIQGGDMEGLSVKQTEPFGPAFVVQSSAKTPAGKYTLYVSDRSGNRQFVEVLVNKAPSNSGGDVRETEDLSQTAESLKSMSFEVKGFKCSVKDAGVKDEKIEITIEIFERDGKEATKEEIDNIADKDLINAIREKNSRLKDIEIKSLKINKIGKAIGNN